MIWLLIADGVFIASVFLQTIAVLSLLSEVYHLPMSENLMPMLTSYHDRMSALIPKTLQGLVLNAPHAYGDAALLGIIWFYLFFIKQARRAAETRRRDVISKSSLAERAINSALITILCAITAIIAGPTLLPVLTLPIALWLLIRRGLGNLSWFEVSRGYYVNLIAVAGLVLALTTLPQWQKLI